VSVKVKSKKPFSRNFNVWVKYLKLCLGSIAKYAKDEQRTQGEIQETLCPLCGPRSGFAPFAILPETIAHRKFNNCRKYKASFLGVSQRAQRMSKGRNV
jgi:hypothetical protein